MFFEKKIFFSIKDNRYDLVIIKKIFSKYKIDNIYTIYPELDEEGILIYNNEKNLKYIEQIREQHKIPINKAQVVLSLDSIITRIIEIPKMRKKFIEAFLSNNITEYFSVNFNEYIYDYKIIDVKKSTKDTSQSTMQILIVVIPKIVINTFKEFANEVNITIDHIGIYPNYIENTLKKYNFESIIVADVNSSKIVITILDRGKIFLYSSTSVDSSENEYDEVIENIEYFVNFYSARHFGENLNRIFVVGEYWNNKSFVELLKSQFNIPIVSGIPEMPITIEKNEKINHFSYLDALGGNIKERLIYNKSIDFLKRASIGEDKNSNKIFNFIILILSIITIVWPIYFSYKINSQILLLDTNSIDKKIIELSGNTPDLDELNKEKEIYEQKENWIKTIKDEEFDYLNILNTLRKGLPSNVKINNITLDREKVDIKFNVNNTLDVVKLVIAINNLDIFEHIEIIDVNLNDEVDEFNLKLNIIPTPKRGELNENK